MGCLLSVPEPPPVPELTPEQKRVADELAEKMSVLDHTPFFLCFNQAELEVHTGLVIGPLFSPNHV